MGWYRPHNPLFGNSKRICCKPSTSECFTYKHILPAEVARAPFQLLNVTVLLDAQHNSRLVYGRHLVIWPIPKWLLCSVFPLRRLTKLPLCNVCTLYCTFLLRASIVLCWALFGDVPFTSSCCSIDIGWTYTRFTCMGYVWKCTSIGGSSTWRAHAACATYFIFYCNPHSQLYGS